LIEFNKQESVAWNFHDLATVILCRGCTRWLDCYLAQVAQGEGSAEGGMISF